LNNSLPASKSSADALSGRSLADACSDWLLYGDLEGWSPRTIDDRRHWMQRLRAFLEARGLGFDREGLSRWFIALKRGETGTALKARALKPASEKHVHTLVKAFASWCVEDGKLSDNPMRRIPAPILKDTSVKTFTNEELARIIAAARKTRYAARDTALVLFLADTGARCSEVAAVRLRDLDLTARRATIVSGKGGRTRPVAFGKETARMLWQYLRVEVREPDDFVFTGERTGDQMTRGGLTNLLRRIGDKAGVPYVGAHRFRHNCAVAMLRNGAHTFGVMSQLGHQQISTTQIYVKLAESDVTAVHRLASPVDNLRKGGPR
jgi:integrase/recombinase XerD